MRSGRSSFGILPEAQSGQTGKGSRCCACRDATRRFAGFRSPYEQFGPNCRRSCPGNGGVRCYRRSFMMFLFAYVLVTLACFMLVAVSGLKLAALVKGAIEVRKGLADGADHA